MTLDKKVVSGRIRFILPDRIGSVRLNDDVTTAEIEDAVGYVMKRKRTGDGS